jgi:hypothetical protein
MLQQTFTMKQASSTHEAFPLKTISSEPMTSLSSPPGKELTMPTTALSLRKLLVAARPQSNAPLQHSGKSVSVIKKKTSSFKKGVRFAPIAHVHCRRPVSDLSHLWYQRADYNGFERDRRSTVSAVHQVNGDVSSLDPAKFCLRGLEQHLTKRQVFARRLNAFKCKRIVLEQQRYQQYTTGKTDPNTLRVVSQLYSEQPTKRAHLRAILEEALDATP